MNAPSATRAEPVAPLVLRRAVGAEWTRLWTVRSTWLFALVATAGVVGISLLVGSDSRGEGQTEAGETVWLATQTLGMIALLVLLSMAAVSTTADYSTGGIVPTLQWTPRRGLLLAARSFVIAATVTLLGLALALVSAVLINRIAPVLAMPWAEGAETLAALGYVYALGVLLAVGLGLFLRSTAGTIVAVLALMLILPLLLGNFSYSWAQELAVLLPGSSAIKLITGDGLPGLTTTGARVTLAAWGIGALAVGGWRLTRTDANR
jgi:ABC-2 type transport system permease protein